MASAAQLAANWLNVHVGRLRQAAIRWSPFVAPARGTLRHRALNASGAVLRKSYIGLAEPIYRMRSVGAISVESRFHAAGNRSSPVVRPSTHALTRVAQDAGAVPSLSKDALSPSSREASGRPCHSHQPRSCTVTMRRLLDAGYGAVTGAANPASGKKARVAANPHHATPPEE